VRERPHARNVPGPKAYEDLSAARGLLWTIFFVPWLDEELWSSYHIDGEETHMHKWGPLCATL